MQQHLESHWLVVKRIPRYLAGTIDHGLDMQRSSILNVVGFCDADWASDPDDITLGFCIYLGSNLVSWHSKKQHTVSISNKELNTKAWPI